MERNEILNGNGEMNKRRWRKASVEGEGGGEENVEEKRSEEEELVSEAFRTSRKEISSFKSVHIRCECVQMESDR